MNDNEILKQDARRVARASEIWTVLQEYGEFDGVDEPPSTVYWGSLTGYRVHTFDDTCSLVAMGSYPRSTSFYVPDSFSVEQVRQAIEKAGEFVKLMESFGEQGEE